MVSLNVNIKVSILNRICLIFHCVSLRCYTLFISWDKIEMGSLFSIAIFYISADSSLFKEKNYCGKSKVDGKPFHTQFYLGRNPKADCY